MTEKNKLFMIDRIFTLQNEIDWVSWEDEDISLTDFFDGRDDLYDMYCIACREMDMYDDFDDKWWDVDNKKYEESVKQYIRNKIKEMESKGMFVEVDGDIEENIYLDSPREVILHGIHKDVMEAARAIGIWMD